MLSALFTSVADALISYAIDKLDPAEAVKSWLRGVTVTLAFQKSLARTYSAFARQYPDYANSLFDPTFLTGKAVPELSKLLVRGQHPDPALLAQAWGESIGADSEFSKSATKPASDFLLWLEAELEGEPTFQSLFDSRALDNIESGIEKLTQEIQRGLDSALKLANGYQIQIGGNVTNSNIIVGDNNTVNQYFYSGDFISLNEYYIPPDGVFQRVDVDKFVGRDWLTAKVDAFLNDPQRKSGAFLLIGDAGVGKTSFMAHLVKDRRYLHLFAEQAPGQAMLQRAMQSLGSQLVTRYQVDPYKDRDTLNALSVFPDFLERILRLAASTLTEGEKIVIVCDALDEAGVFPDHFVFGLPKELPDGVYFILSQRPVNVKLPNFEPVIEKLEAQGEGNLQDIEAYLSAVAKRPEVAGQIRSKEYSEEFFIQTLKEKSQGVWMYLHYIIKEIESGARAPLDLANLPTGLVGYYAEYWDAWRIGKRGKGEEAWDELYAPLLTTLAAAQEAITVAQLTQWAGVTVTPHGVTRLLSETWRAFITEKVVDGKKVYAPYHLSFKDFITGRVDTDKLPPAQANLVKDLAVQAVDAHKSIMSAFEKDCNGEWEKLVEQDYPRLHLTAHLNGAGKYEKLRVMLTEGDEKIKWAEAREQKEETYAGYLNDLTYVWDYAEREQNYALAIRCMLIENSIHSLASKIAAKILVSSVKDGFTSHRYYLNVIRLKPHPVDKAEAIEMIAPELPEPLLKEALIIANEIRDETWRFYALLALIPYLPNELKEQASQDALSDIKDDIDNSRLEDKLIHLYKSQFEYLYKELILMFKNEDTQRRRQILIEIANLLSNAKKEKKSPELAIIKASAYHPKAIYKQTTTSYNREYFRIIKSSWEYKKYILLTNYFAYFSSKQKNKFLSEIKELESKYVYICVLTKIIPVLTSRQKSKAIQKILFSLTDFQDDLIHLSVLSDILDFIDGKLRVRIIRTALQILNNNNQVAVDKADNTKLAGILKTLASKAESTYVTDLFSFVCNIKSKDLQTRSIYVLLPYLNEDLKRRCFLIALEADAFYKLNILRRIVPFITDEQKMILAESLRGKDLHYEGELLASLLPTKNRELIKCIIDNVSAVAISSLDIRSDMLEKILPLLDEEEIEFFSSPILLAIRGIKKASLKANLLLALSSQLKSEQKEIIIQESLSVALTTARLPDRVNLLIRVALMLDEKQRKAVLQEAAKAALSISDGYSGKITSLTEVAKHLLDERPRFVQEVLSVAKINSGDAGIQAEALVQLSALFENESETKDKILQDAFAISLKTKTSSRAEKILSSFDESQKNILIHASLVNTRTTSDMFTRALILKNISLLVDNATKNALLRESFLSAKKVELSWQLADLLIQLVQEINIVELKSEVFLYTLSVFENSIDNIYRSHYFEALVSQLQHLDSNTQERTFSLIDKLEDKRDRLEALRLFTEISNENIKRNLLLKVQKIDNIFVQGKALGFVFTEDKDGNNLLNFDEQNKIANRKRYIIPYLKMNSQEGIEDGFKLILALTPALIHFSGPEIADELYRTITDVTRWWQ